MVSMGKLGELLEFTLNYVFFVSLRIPSVDDGMKFRKRASMIQGLDFAGGPHLGTQKQPGLLSGQYPHANWYSPLRIWGLDGSISISRMA